VSDYIRITDRNIELTDEGVEELIADYTPTTGDVRARYVRDHGAHFVSDWAEFDRWLAEVKAQVWEEGYTAGDADAHTENRLDMANPYRGENK
jgi:hypothetical protein